MMLKDFRGFLVLTFLFALSGCATSRTNLSIDVPVEHLSPANGQQIYIRSVIDNRTFQNKPSTPDIPSLGKGGLNNATSEIKSRAIGRKRNTYGKALGDILLDEGQSVEKTIYQTTRSSLMSLGYEVTNKQEEAKPDALIMDISIDKFWAWLTPGFWALHLESAITTTHKTSSKNGGSKTIVIVSHSEIGCQAATESNWKELFNKAVHEFMGHAKIELKGIKES